MITRFLFISFIVLVPCYCKIYFKEEFMDAEKWESRWIPSLHNGINWGKFILTNGEFYGDAEINKGIQTTEDLRFYGLSTKFEPFSNKDKTLVIQFTVKHEQDMDCGGGYMKVFDCSLDPKDLHGETPYLIMFGPDICGPGTKRVHVIFNYAGKNHLIKKEIRCMDDIYTHLYTLIVNPDNTYVVKIDNERVEGGDLDSDWDFLPPKRIKDPDAKKPDDWDENPEIDDPEDIKPDDWDQVEYILDPDAKKPDDWDDEMDGEWEPPQINNPAFRGEWNPRQIDNPNYKGPWLHPEIYNPDFIPDEDLYMFHEICGVGFELWQVKSGTVFDNILITDNESEAETHQLQVFKATKIKEHKMKEDIEKEKIKETKVDNHNIDDENNNDNLGDSTIIDDKPKEDESRAEL